MIFIYQLFHLPFLYIYMFFSLFLSNPASKMDVYDSTIVLIPHEHLLPRYSHVRPSDGTYTSQFTTPDVRFGVSLATSSGRRLSVETSALNQSKTWLAIAVQQYAVHDRQW